MTGHDAQRQQWDHVAAGWKRWWPIIEQGAQGVSQRLLDLAAVASGHRVLDIATGIGEPALLAARRVGAAGRVVATDLSTQMLAIARERTMAADLSNLELVNGDAEQLAFASGRFDAVLCRWGMASLPNPMNTLLSIRDLLTPLGAFATAVWDSGPDARPLARIATSVAHTMTIGPASVEEARPKSQTASQILEQQLGDAGFADVCVEAMTLTLEWPTRVDCAQYVLDVSPDLASTFAGASSEQEAEFVQRVAGELRQYERGDGRVTISNVTICGVGRR